MIRSVLRILVGVAVGGAALAFCGWIAFFRERPTPIGGALPALTSPAQMPSGTPAIELHKIADGFDQPTDLQFPPGGEPYAVVLQKTGSARWLDLERGIHGELFRVEVRTASEQGLLGLAFHPRFAVNGRFFINCVVRSGGRDVSQVVEWKLTEATAQLDRARAQRMRVLMEVPQPYVNHNAGQLAFGPDGYLYVGWGDGGAGGDPHGHGQDGTTLLGSMLRIDVDAHSPHGNRAYAIPTDNPFLGQSRFAAETFAYGLRNPWRYSFDPEGRLVVADVGQNGWEEIDIVQAGDNLGWNVREGFACFRAQSADCERKDLVPPVFVYGRELGNSITGGYVYTGRRVAALRGLYVFGDFGSGRIFALKLPRDRAERVERATELGRWPIHPSTFGRDEDGEVYVADFNGGGVYRVAER
jgi:glucose/arabinose dehydrogenase